MVFDTSDSVRVVNSKRKEKSDVGETEESRQSYRERDADGALAAMHRAAKVAHLRAAARSDKIVI